MQMKKYLAESLGTFVLTLFGCDSAAVAGAALGCNSYDAASSVGTLMLGAVVVEVILTFVFVLAILGVTDGSKTIPFAGLVIGLTLAFVHIMGIPLTGTSVNPACSFGPALVMAMNGDATAPNQVLVFVFVRSRVPRLPPWSTAPCAPRRLRTRSSKRVGWGTSSFQPILLPTIRHCYHIVEPPLVPSGAAFSFDL